MDWGEAIKRAAATPYEDEPLEIGDLRRIHGRRQAKFVWRSDKGGLLVRGIVAETEQGLILDEITVRRTESGAQVTSTSLRDLDVGRLLNMIRARVTHQRVIDEARRVHGLPGVDPAILELADIASVKPRRSGRPIEHGDDFYRNVALAYLDELAYLDKLANGSGRGIYERLSPRLGYGATTIKDFVHEARKRGFLTKGHQGRAGAQPGPRLFEGERKR